MALEPTTAGIALGATAITLTGSVFGVQYEALLAGFAGGLCYLTYDPATTKLKVATSLATSSLLAGYATPLLALAMRHYIPWLESMADSPLKISASFFIGLLGQGLLPMVFRKLKGSVSKELDKVSEE